jgi:hypothetical protein
MLGKRGLCSSRRVWAAGQISVAAPRLFLRSLYFLCVPGESGEGSGGGSHRLPPLEPVG